MGSNIAAAVSVPPVTSSTPASETTAYRSTAAGRSSGAGRVRMCTLCVAIGRRRADVGGAASVGSWGRRCSA
eukprot:6400442-Pyramimonas_sp.AAC.1